MDRVALREVDPDDPGGGVARRALAGPLDTEALACNHYRVPPDEGFPGGLHAHPEQEELFVVLDGEATFEWYVPERRADGAGDGEESAAADAGEFRVGTGEAVRFAPGEFQSGRNEGERELVALAVGAPRADGDVRLPVRCPSCDRPVLRLTTGGEEVTLTCPGCGAEHVPAPCPDCGGERLEAALGDDGRPVVACRDCDAEYDRPPVVE